MTTTAFPDMTPCMWSERVCNGSKLPNGEMLEATGAIMWRCYPLGFRVRLVCDVDPARLQYMAHWCGSLEPWQSAESLEECKEQALDAAELLLAEALDLLEQLRTAARSGA